MVSVYSYKTKNAIPDFPIHDKLGIIKKGKQYECGKHDLFAVVIALRYLLPKDLFKKFKQELANLLSKHLSATSCYTEKEFASAYGIPGKLDKDYTLQKIIMKKRHKNQFRKRKFEVVSLFCI